jgi:molecular chaperone DnaK
MTYQLGIDLGTTFTAAAVFRDGQVQIASLGNRAATIPSVLFLREDGSVLVGDAADRRAVSDPDRVAREFKRRIGDSTPLLLGGTPYAAEALSAKLLRYVVDAVTEVEGEQPAHIGVTHPANWGPYKTDLLTQSTRMADLDQVTFLTEPEAAAIYYASNERVEEGAIVAVYDLGGGTFDAAVLQKTPSGSGFKILGTPEGIERLGGIDFDHAVFAHVNRALDGAIDELDPTDEKAIAAIARLRHDCVEAKEALSNDTDVSIPVLLPNIQTSVRLTRTEFEAMIRPTLQDTIGALGRALRSANVQPDDIRNVLLVGGSSRIPLVAQLVSAELGRPVAVDAHPKHSIAYGAALAAAGFHREQTGVIPVIPPAEIVSEPTPPPKAEPVVSEQVAPPAAEPVAPVAPAAATPEPTMAPPAPPPPPTHKPRVPQKFVAPIAAAVAAILVAGLGFYLLNSGKKSPAANIVGTQAPAASASSNLPTPPPGVPLFSRIDSISLAGGKYVVNFETFGYQPQLGEGNHHVHFFFNTVPPLQAGNPGSGPWQLYPTSTGTIGPSPFTLLGPSDKPSGATQMCILVANFDHSVIQGTGNCMPLPS